MDQRSEALAPRPGKVPHLDGGCLDRLGVGRDQGTLGGRLHAHRGPRPTLDHSGPTLLPVLMRAGGGLRGALIDQQQVALPQPVLHLALEIQRLGIPPHHFVGAGLRTVRSGGDAEGAEGAVGSVEHRLLPELRAARRSARLGAQQRCGMDGGVEGLEPVPQLLIGGHRHHQEIPGAGRGDVRHPDHFLAVALQEGGGIGQKLRRSAPRERHRPDLSFPVDEAGRPARLGGSAGIAQDDHGKLQPLGLVHAHDAHAFGAFLHHRRFRRVAAFRVGRQPIDEGPEAARARRLEPAREIQHAQDVGQGLLSGGPDGDAGVRPGRVQEPRERLRDGPPVPAQV